MPRCAAVVDLGVERVQGLSCLNSLADTPDLNWTTVVGMLILAFPEVQWIIANQPGLNAPPLLCGRGGLAPNRLDYDCDLEALLQLLDEGYSPLFDGTGFVSEIRKAMVYAVPSEKGISPRIESRSHRRRDALRLPLRLHGVPFRVLQFRDLDVRDDAAIFGSAANRWST